MPHRRTIGMKSSCGTKCKGCGHKFWTKYIKQGQCSACRYNLSEESSAKWRRGEINVDPHHHKKKRKPDPAVPPPPPIELTITERKEDKNKSGVTQTELFGHKPGYLAMSFEAIAQHLRECNDNEGCTV